MAQGEPVFAVFQSTLPVWGGTEQAQEPETGKQISIHPPRVGRDPRLPLSMAGTMTFQSTLPVWGGTAKAHKNSL